MVRRVIAKVCRHQDVRNLHPECVGVQSARQFWWMLQHRPSEIGEVELVVKCNGPVDGPAAGVVLAGGRMIVDQETRGAACILE